MLTKTQKDDSKALRGQAGSRAACLAVVVRVRGQPLRYSYQPSASTPASASAPQIPPVPHGTMWLSARPGSATRGTRVHSSGQVHPASTVSLRYHPDMLMGLDDRLHLPAAKCWLGLKAGSYLCHESGLGVFLRTPASILHRSIHLQSLIVCFSNKGRSGCSRDWQGLRKGFAFRTFLLSKPHPLKSALSSFQMFSCHPLTAFLGAFFVLQDPMVALWRCPAPALETEPDCETSRSETQSHRTSARFKP